MNCLVCNNDKLVKIIERNSKSITSISNIIDFPTRVFICTECGHAQTELSINPDIYYEDEYNLHTSEGFSDDIVVLGDGRQMYRSAYQVDILKDKIDFDGVNTVLEYGAGHGNSLERISLISGRLNVYAFDIAKQHLSSWLNIIPKEQCAYGSLPDEWKGVMDIVYCCYVLEHSTNPVNTLREINNVLSDSGKAVVIVPDPYFNNIDLLAVDHINHFSENSLNYVAYKAGLEVLEIDKATQPGSFWVTMIKSKSARYVNTDPECVNQLKSIGSWFMKYEKKIKQFLFDQSEESELYIYGSGGWGIYVLSAIGDEWNVKGFIDRNPTLHGKSTRGINIYSPEDVDNNAISILCALNPKIAKEAMEKTFPELYSAGKVFIPPQ